MIPRKASVFLIPLLLAAGCSSQPAKVTQPAPPRGVRRASAAIVHPLAGSKTLPNMNLLSADFQTQSDGFVAGTYGADKGTTTGFVMCTLDGGRTWRLLTQTPGEAYTYLAFASPTKGLAVAKAVTPSTATAPSVLYQTTDGGSHWTAAETVQGSISAIAMAPDGHPWIAVSGPCTKTSCSGEILARSSAGFGVLWNAPGPVLALAFHGAKAWAETMVSSSGAVAAQINESTDGGKTWTVKGALPISTWGMVGLTTATGFTGQLAFTSSGNGIASLFSMAGCSMGGCALSGVYRTTDGGTGWAPVASVKISCQFGPELASSGSLVAVVQGINLAACAGQGSTLFLSADGGETFTSPKDWADSSIHATGFIPGGGMWVLASAAGYSTLQISDAGGTAWRQAFPAVAPTSLVSFGPGAIYGAGDQSDPAAIVRSTDGGTTWRVLSSLANEQAVSIDFASPQDGWVGTVPMGTQPGAFSRIAYTSDGGGTWTTSYRPPAGQTIAPSVHFFTPTRGTFLNLGAACPGNCALFGAATANGGGSWHSISAPAAPSGIVSVAFLSPSQFLAVTMGSVTSTGEVYATNDAGREWTTRVDLPSSINGDLNIAFPTPRTGYMVVNDVKQPSGSGHAQVAVLAVMKTDDGGRAWVLRDLPGVQDAWFASVSFRNVDDGILLAGDTVWTTSDGGAVWTQKR